MRAVAAPQAENQPQTANQPKLEPSAPCPIGGNAQELTASLRQRVESILATPDGAAKLAERIQAGAPDCWRVEKAQEAPIYLIAGTQLPWPTVIAWQGPSGWQVAAVPKDQSEFVAFGFSAMRDGRPDLLLRNTVDGTGHFGSVQHLTVDANGTVKLTKVTPVFERVGFDFLAPDLILVTHRGTLWDEFPGSGNCCVPSLKQQLLRWDGKAMQTVAERMVPHPDLTLNRLRRALAANDDAAAAKLVSDPALLSQARRLLIDPPDRFIQYEPLNSGLMEIEWKNWSALPAPYRKALPPELQHRSYVIERPAGRFALHLKRTPAQWLLTGIQALKPGEVPTDAANKP
jgi:hypothetical protein